MANRKEVTNQISSVKNIRQITRAMQFVAASKLKRAQDATLASRPYGHSIDEVIADLASVLGEEGHPLLRTPASGAPRTIVLFTTDRGLAGALTHVVVGRVGILRELAVATGRVLLRYEEQRRGEGAERDDGERQIGEIGGVHGVSPSRPERGAREDHAPARTASH